METTNRTCAGPVTWFVVPADSRFTEPGAVVFCEACGAVIDPTHVDPRHAGVVVMLHEDDYRRRRG